MAFQTEYPFTLPRGFVDNEGTLHKTGVMRLATAKDEIIPLQDYRVQSNRAYLVIILLSRVITKLGEIKFIDTDIIENLFSTDLAYLQEGSESFDDYVEAVEWAQDFARINRQVMMENVVVAVDKVRELPPFKADVMAVNCHHNYISREHHFGADCLITRKGHRPTGRAAAAARRDAGPAPITHPLSGNECPGT